MFFYELCLTTKLKMKLKTLLIFLLAASAITSFGQKDSIVPKKYILGVSMGTIVDGNVNGINYYAHFTIEKGKHFFAIGPLIGRQLQVQTWWDEARAQGKMHLNGVHCVYQINPNSKGKIFDFYFQNEFIFHYNFSNGVIKYDYDDYGNYLTTPISRPYTFHQTDFEDFIGYGIKIKFLNNFYMNQSLGIGISSSYLTSDFGNSRYNRKLKDTQTDFLFKFGLGYIFVKQTKKTKPLSNIDKIFYDK
jgi:hypothetical protein